MLGSEQQQFGSVPVGGAGSYKTALNEYDCRKNIGGVGCFMSIEKIRKIRRAS
jgi:hypothetical protein